MNVHVNTTAIPHEGSPIDNSVNPILGMPRPGSCRFRGWWYGFIVRINYVCCQMVFTCAVDPTPNNHIPGLDLSHPRSF